MKIVETNGGAVAVLNSRKQRAFERPRSTLVADLDANGALERVQGRMASLALGGVGPEVIQAALDYDALVTGLGQLLAWQVETYAKMWHEPADPR